MSEPDIRLILPVPPSANALFTYRAHSRQRIKTDAYRAWIQEGALSIARAGGRDSLKHVRIALDLPFSYKRDLDNAIKPILDLLKTMAVILDDRWVDELYVRRVPVTEPLTVTVSIWKL